MGGLEKCIVYARNDIVDALAHMAFSSVVDASESVPVSSIGGGLELRGVGRRAGVIPGVDNGGRAEMYAYVNAEDGCPIPYLSAGLAL